AALSLLYSDIKPDYYARQGYVLCPAYEGWAGPTATADGGRGKTGRARLLPSHGADESGSAGASPSRVAGDETASGEMQLCPLNAAQELSDIAVLYAGYHGALPLAVERPADYWEYLLRKGPADEFLWLMD